MQFISLRGLTSYQQANDFQKKLVDLRVQDRIPDTVVFLEHRPVVTQGSGLQKLQGQKVTQPTHMPLPKLPEGIEFCKSERGGDLTYHGPGQLVIYPVLKLENDSSVSSQRDVGGYIRNLEALIVEWLSKYGLSGQAKKGATGVWIGEKKIASIGIAIRRWVSYHGIAINIVNDLKPFHLFSPCGFSPEVMTNLKALGTSLCEDSWRKGIENEFAELISRKVGSPNYEIEELLMQRSGKLISQDQFF